MMRIWRITCASSIIVPFNEENIKEYVERDNTIVILKYHEIFTISTILMGCSWPEPCCIIIQTDHMRPNSGCWQPLVWVVAVAWREVPTHFSPLYLVGMQKPTTQAHT